MKLFQVKSVQLQPENLICLSLENLQEELKVYSDNIILLNSQLLAKKINEKFPCLEKVEVSKYINGSLVIKVEERKAAAIVEVLKDSEKIKILKEFESTNSAKLDNVSDSEATGSGKYLVTKDGYLFSEIFNSTQYPLIVYISAKAKLGYKIENNSISKTLIVLKKLYENQLNYQNIIISGNSLLITNEQKTGDIYIKDLIFSLEKDVNEQLIALQLIVQKARVDAKSYQKIDLRYDKPVVVYTQNKR